MKIWVAHVGEPLPIDSEHERQLRMSLFARQLADAGHDVLWWTSSFDHTHKRQRFDQITDIAVTDRLKLRLLPAKPYRSNISIDRLVNHRQVATAFTALAPKEAKPDIIYATMPTLELAAAAAVFGRSRGIPVVIDVRDLHPDIYLSLAPRGTKTLARAALTPLYRDLRTALENATAIFAIAPSFLEWALKHASRSEKPYDRVFPLAYPQLTASAEEIDKAKGELERSGVRANKQILWYVGTFNRWIDLEAPIRAARILAERGDTTTQFVLSGSGDFESQWRAQTADLPNVVFTGWVGVPSLLYMKSIAWAGLAPYRPGFLTVGNKLFEYMAGGLPVLLSIEGDARKIIEKHGAGLHYGASAEGLVAAIDKLRSDGVRDKMASNSRAAFAAHYSAARVYGEMENLVLQIVAENALAS